MTGDQNNHKSVTRFLRAWSYTLGMVLLAALLALGTPLGPKKAAVLSLAIASLLLVPVMSRVRTDWGLMAIATLSTVVGSFFLYFALPLNLPVLDQIFKPVPFKPIGIYQAHNRLGYRHIPGATGRHETPEYSVTYSIDQDHCRITPTPDQPLGRVLVLGGSFTFGQGVEDDEPFPARLGYDYWRDYKVGNCATSGWGTSHAYVALSEQLAADDPPVLVIYGMIVDHIRRNYLRDEWLAHLQVSHNPNERRDTNRGGVGYHPHFELVDGRLQFQGVVTGDAGRAITPELQDTELRMTVAFLREMNEAARAAGVPFAVVLLAEASGRTFEPAFLDSLRANEVPFLDLLDMIPETLGESHPNAADHQRIADAVAASFIGRLFPGQR